MDHIDDTTSLLRQRLRALFRSELEEKKELAPLTALYVGGEAEFYIAPSDITHLPDLLCLRSQLAFPLYILGGGTNVVFADGCIKGVFLSTRNLKAYTWFEDRGYVYLRSQAGHPLAKAVAEAATEGLTGAEFAVGIPGTLGGAIAGNAGAGGHGICELAEEITTLEANGTIRKWGRGDFQYFYRYCSLTSTERFITECTLRFLKSGTSNVREAMEKFREARSAQPHGVKSAGCSFKNPPGDSAGRLLDFCGCKGTRIGDAIVSCEHANFIVNLGNADGNDIFKLIKLCQDRVLKNTGILLEPEVKLIGFSE